MGLLLLCACWSGGKRIPKLYSGFAVRLFYFSSCSDGTELQREGRLALRRVLEHPTLPLGVCDSAGEVMKLVFPLWISAPKCPRG